MSVTFRSAYEPPVATLTIEGELDVLARGRLAWQLLDLERLSCPTVRLDLDRVSYVDACSMRLLEETRRRVRARGDRMELVAASLCFALVSRAAGYTVLATEAARVARRSDLPSQR